MKKKKKKETLFQAFLKQNNCEEPLGGGLAILAWWWFDFVGQNEEWSSIQIEEERKKLWNQIEAECNASPLFARQVAEAIQAQIGAKGGKKVMNAGRGEKIKQMYGNDLRELQERLAMAEQNSCVVELHAFDQNADANQTKSKPCEIFFNEKNKGNTRINFPMLRVGVTMLGESVIDFDGMCCAL